MPRGVIYVCTPLIVFREFGGPIHSKHADETLPEQAHSVFGGQLKRSLDRGDGFWVVFLVRHFPV